MLAKNYFMVNGDGSSYKMLQDGAIQVSTDGNGNRPSHLIEWYKHFSKGYAASPDFCIPWIAANLK